VSTGAAQSFNASVAGENVYFTFNANRGDNQELTLSNINVPGAQSTNGVSVSIYDPTGVNVTNASCYATNPGAGCRFALWNLLPGKYSVVVNPNWGGIINFTAQLQPDTTGTSLTANIPATINLAAGQVQRITFTADLGSSVALNLSNVSTTAPTGQPVYVNVYRPDTGAITSAYYSYTYTTSSATLNLPNLPASGVYTAVVYTPYGTPGMAQLTLVPQ
jgi:hypothetical protein